MSNHTVDNHGASHGSVKSYLIGFVLAAVLTIIPFWVVMSGSMTGFAAGMGRCNVQGAARSVFICCRG